MAQTGSASRSATPGAAAPALLFAALLNANLVQWQAMAAWQQALLTAHAEWWDTLTVRYAGGCPIDA